MTRSHQSETDAPTGSLNHTGPRFATRAIHHGYDPAGFSNAVQPPVFLTSTYGFESVAANEAAAALGGRLCPREYNPTTEILERRLANLEGAEAGLVVASGMAAFGTLILSLLSQGDELIVHRTLYANTLAMVEQAVPRFGIKVVAVDLCDPQRRRTLAETLDEIAGRMPVVVGVGALRTNEAVRFAQDAKGAAAGLLAAASYTPLTEDEVFEHFSTVARESGLPIVVYDNPGTTHFHFSPPLVSRLAKVGAIVIIKNPTDKGDAIKSHLADQRRTVPEGFSIATAATGTPPRPWSPAPTHGTASSRHPARGLHDDRHSGATGRCGRSATYRCHACAALEPLQGVLEPSRRLCTCRIARHLPCRPRPILPLPSAAKRQIAAALERLPSDASR
ncbi:PLP-dependent transferase [Mesorhizobium australicum]|uniref:dihydrodipicolinate synthase family protein n=1 Tax=Mesorhizobium australicum TaxID=536018 RepID=UPI0033392E32